MYAYACTYVRSKNVREARIFRADEERLIRKRLRIKYAHEKWVMKGNVNVHVG